MDIILLHTMLGIPSLYFEEHPHAFKVDRQF